MFGHNPIMKQDLGSGTTLRVVQGSPFFTIQGEGPFAGHPAVFIRLHGCNLRCWFCDTEFSSPDDPEWQTVRLARVAFDMANYEPGKGRATLFVITGGEPLRQNILPLVSHLLKQGMRVQIETAGTLWIDGLETFSGPTWGHRFTIVVSPKTPTVHEKILEHAHAFKYVVGQNTHVDDEGRIWANTQKEEGTPRPLAKAGNQPVYLSPMDEYNETVNAENRRKVAALAMRHGYIAGVQMHKLLNIQEP